MVVGNGYSFAIRKIKKEIYTKKVIKNNFRLQVCWIRVLIPFWDINLLWFPIMINDMIQRIIIGE